MQGQLQYSQEVNEDAKPVTVQSGSIWDTEQEPQPGNHPQASKSELRKQTDKQPVAEDAQLAAAKKKKHK